MRRLKKKFCFRKVFWENLICSVPFLMGAIAFSLSPEVDHDVAGIGLSIWWIVFMVTVDTLEANRERTTT